MLRELKRIDDLTNALKAVETAVGFLSTHGGQPNQLYMEYLDKKLRYEPKQYLASKSVRILTFYPFDFTFTLLIGQCQML